MVRSLWSAATGMNAQQTNVDTIANNLANVNTVGYKTEQNQFKSLLYQELQTKTTSANGETKPSSAQVGLGVRNAAITSIFRQGSFLSSDSDTAFAIQGNGFFAVRGSDNQTYYTRNGDFNWTTDGNGYVALTDSEGRHVLNSSGAIIRYATNNYNPSRFEFSSTGELSYPDANGNLRSLNVRLGLYQFNNPAGLEKIGGTLFAVTDASGAVINEATNNTVAKSKIAQGYLEGSNVQVADEMVNLIVAQRAYEMNSKAITTSDEMLQEANELKR